jgi:hypothetical protein
MSDTIKIARATIFTPAGTAADGETVWGLPICFWGPPGVGKTHQISKLARSHRMPLEVLSPGERGEGAFGVTPVPGPNNKVLNYPPADWVANFAVEDGGVLFLDEINQAPPPLQPALMGILLARRVGGHYLGHKVRPIAAANPTEQAAGGWDFAPPVANRMGHLTWPDVGSEGWADWLLGDEGAMGTATLACDEERRVLASWDEPWARTRGIVAGFIRAKGAGMLHKMPAMGSHDLGRAWPSPRTWEMAARAYASSSVHRLDAEATEEFTAAFVGRGAASEMFAYAEKLDLPNPADVLDGKVAFKHDPKRLDRTVAVLGSCHALVVPEKADKRKERTTKLWQMLGEKKILDEAMDVAFASVKALVKASLHTQQAAYTILAKMNPLLKAAGIQYDPNAKDD